MIYQAPRSTIEHNGKTYKLNMGFDRVLLALKIATDKSVFPQDAVEGALSVLVKGRSKDISLLIAIFDSLSDGKHDKKSVKSVDFIQDENYIYASFMQAYGIDLHKTKPHWKDFIALFNGLPNDTIIKQIMEIRTKKIPKMTKHNAAAIRALMEQKATYRLDVSPEERRESFNSGLQTLAKAMIAMARK